jgi:hypothetical protein
MCKRRLQLRAHQVIALILIGLMSGGALLCYLSRSHTNFCLEERVLETEDGRLDVLALVFIQPKTVSVCALPRVRFETVAIALVDPRSAHQAAHLQRGPPHG